MSTNLYTIAYRDPNPEQRARVVQSLLTSSSSRASATSARTRRRAVKFLDEQIKRYEESLQAPKNRLKDFKLKYLGVADSRTADYFRRISQLRNDIEAAQARAAVVEQARDAYKRELAGEAPTSCPTRRTPSADGDVPELDARIAALKKELDDLLRKYTDAASRRAARRGA